MKNVAILSLILITLALSACQKYESGNTRISSVEFVVYQNDWVEFGTKGSPGYGFAADIPMPEITDNVINYGSVTLYMKSGDSWVQVPIYFYASGYQAGFIYAMKRGLFSIEYYESDQQTVRPDGQAFRLVILQPY